MKAIDFINKETEGVNVLPSTKDKIKYLITKWETAEIDADNLAEILTLMLEETKQ